MAPITDLPRTNSISEGVRPLSFCFRRQSNNVRYGSLADLDMCPRHFRFTSQQWTFAE